MSPGTAAQPTAGQGDATRGLALPTWHPGIQFIFAQWAAYFPNGGSNTALWTSQGAQETEAQC